MKFERHGDIDCLVQRGDPIGPHIVLLHGYGADFKDLAGLTNYISAPEGTNWYFPNGIVEVPVGPHMTGRGWFPIDFVALERALQTGQSRYFADAVPDGFETARDRVKAMIEALDIAPERLFLGGFSQGAMITGHVAIHQQLPLAGLLQLSSTLVGQTLLDENQDPEFQLKIFQSHGQQDMVLPIAGAKALKDYFTSRPFAVEWHEFPGGHEIPLNVLQKLSKFLQR
ncbi:alpha/beta hydrolase [Pseudobacteriovorax antillogorgiicola]|uniref:Phospholipase/carboxylesterase n=1 Tax=Pseudobacteriovorax antillogorgiicola TaxID=1513793 RepID=A0A1Y6CJW6_9BACT|nr:esterase [Pseudobacteriovorax antillogorgiicola]TCS48344.1 phospholipase/carboxylesterase [Pseudobacteriovorax antillogorgiicola]SMF56340.1 phospholipase/carboxylesterase [Pseudobacteriovorax antillogorgiicola]